MTTLDEATWSAVTYPLIRRGYDAARAGAAVEVNPFPAETFGAEAWGFGHKIRSLPRPVRWAMLLWAGWP